MIADPKYNAECCEDNIIVDEELGQAALNTE